MPLFQLYIYSFFIFIDNCICRKPVVADGACFKFGPALADFIPVDNRCLARIADFIEADTVPGIYRRLISPRFIGL